MTGEVHAPGALLGLATLAGLYGARQAGWLGRRRGMRARRPSWLERVAVAIRVALLGHPGDWWEERRAREKRRALLNGRMERPHPTKRRAA